MVANPLLDVVLRCTTKLVSFVALSVQVRLILLEDVAVAPKPLGAIGGSASVVAKASLEKPESPAPLEAYTR